MQMGESFFNGMASALGAGVVIVGWRWLRPLREIIAVFVDPDDIHDPL
jgi:hypothetical protein